MVRRLAPIRANAPSTSGSARSGSAPRRSTIDSHPRPTRTSQAVGPERSQVHFGAIRRRRTAPLGSGAGERRRRKRPKSPRCTCTGASGKSRRRCLPQASAPCRVAPSIQAAPSSKRPWGELARTTSPARSRVRSRASLWMVCPSGIGPTPGWPPRRGPTGAPRLPSTCPHDLSTKAICVPSTVGQIAPPATEKLPGRSIFARPGGGFRPHSCDSPFFRSG